jgi:Na+/H+-dicarboxylate symporter
VILPIGATIHMDGTCLSAVLKIALIHGLLGLEFSGVGAMTGAVGVALLGGMVTSGIPGGAFVGEVVIVTLYGFPAWTLPIISMIGQLVDPVSTMLNATGDTVASMMVARILAGKDWLDRPES